MAPSPQASNALNASATDGLHWAIWVYAILAVGFIEVCICVYLVVVVFKRQFSTVAEDIESKVHSLVTIPISDLPANTQFVEFGYGGKETQSTLSDTCSSLSTSGDCNDSQPPSPALTLVEEASTGITDCIKGYSSDSLASMYSELSMDSDSVQTFWDPRRSLPTIRIEECEDPCPSEQDLEDTCLATALSLLDLTLNHTMDLPPSSHVPHSESESLSESESESDPLAVLCDILELNDALDCSYKALAGTKAGATFAASGLADDWKYAFSTTVPLRISKSRRL